MLAGFPFDVDSGGIEVAAVWASASTGGQHGDGEECAEYGAAAAEIELVGSVRGGAVPDVGDVGRPGESDERVDRCSGGKVSSISVSRARSLPVPVRSWVRVMAPSAKAAERSVDVGAVPHLRWLRANPRTLDIAPPLSQTDRMPRTAILYARSNRDVSRLSEDAAQLEEIIGEHRSRLATSRDDRHH